MVAPSYARSLVRSKLCRNIKKLSPQPTLARVLFVQHMAENDPNQGVLRRSFIACAGTLGNGLRTAEGGIPKSSRLGVSLKVARADAGVS